MLSSLRCCSARLHLPPRSEAPKMSATRFSPDRAQRCRARLWDCRSPEHRTAPNRCRQFASTVLSYAVDFPAFRKRHGGDLTSPPKGL
jgi:hypothetical protein